MRSNDQPRSRLAVLALREGRVWWYTRFYEILPILGRETWENSESVHHIRLGMLLRLVHHTSPG